MSEKLSGMEFGDFESAFDQWANEAVKATLIDPDSSIGRSHRQYLAGHEADIKIQALALQKSEPEHSLAEVTKVIMSRMLEKRVERHNQDEPGQLAA